LVLLDGDRDHVGRAAVAERDPALDRAVGLDDEPDVAVAGGGDRAVAEAAAARAGAARRGGGEPVLRAGGKAGQRELAGGVGDVLGPAAQLPLRRVEASAAEARGAGPAAAAERRTG